MKMWVGSWNYVPSMLEGAVPPAVVAVLTRASVSTRAGGAEVVTAGGDAVKEGAVATVVAAKVDMAGELAVAAVVEAAAARV
jgi:hypothetical protein